MHSREDGLIGFRHSEQNFAAANEPKFFCELNGRHNDEAWEAPGFHEVIEKFLREVGSRAQDKSSVEKAPH
jgi:hypothetical protein